MTLSAGIRRILLPLILATVIGVALVPLSTGTREAPGASNDFRSFMEPRLVALLASSRNVESMVTERSRNILALRAESERIETITADIEEYLRGHESPGWAEPVITHYHQGSDLIRMAIDEAYTALGSFDFSAMPDMIPLFSEGTDEIEEALGTLRDSTQDGSSYTGIGVA